MRVIDLIDKYGHDIDDVVRIRDRDDLCHEIGIVTEIGYDELGEWEGYNRLESIIYVIRLRCGHEIQCRHPDTHRIFWK